MPKLNNGFLIPIVDCIEVIPGKADEVLFALLSKHGVPKGRDTIVDWDRIEHHSFEFDFDGCEQEISAALASSPIMSSPTMTVFCSMSNPLMVLGTSDFCKHWYTFWRASGYMEVLAISDDGMLIVELTEHPGLLCSNFSVR